MSSLTNPHDGVSADWRSDPHDWATKRARYVKRTTPLEEADAEIVAYAELGYSASGIASAVGLTDSTVTDHFDDIESACGPTALMSRTPEELELRSDVGLGWPDHV